MQNGGGSGSSSGSGKNCATFVNVGGHASTAAAADLKTLLNNYKSVNSPTYTRISDLRIDCAYKIVSMERVTTPYGETVMAIVEGLVGDEYYLRVYLPRRYSEALTDQDIFRYNSGYGERLSLVRRPPTNGSSNTPLEFV